MTSPILQTTINGLIDEGRAVLATEFEGGTRAHGASYLMGRPRFVSLQAFAKWQTGCLNLVRMLGEAGQQWKDDFAQKKNTPVSATRMLGTLEGIADSMTKGLLIKVEDIVRAEAFENLFEQADHLLSEGYFLAAGVLGRAVLEEHLRKLCDLTKCRPTKSKPTINDFNGNLYKGKHINLTQMKHFESLASIGNAAAHNDKKLTANEVERLLRDIRDILVKSSSSFD